MDYSQCFDFDFAESKKKFGRKYPILKETRAFA